MNSSKLIHISFMLFIALGVAGHMDKEVTSHGVGTHEAQETPKTYPPTYFTSGNHQLEINAHIALMIISWFILLPIATMLSLARSRYTHFFRLGLIATNIVGVLFGVSYKSKTADLYPGSLHAAMGWIVTAIVAAQGGHLVLGPAIKLFNRIAGRGERRHDGYSIPAMREICNSLQGHDSPSSRPLDVEATTRADVEDSDTSSDSRLSQEESPESGFTSGDDTFYGESDSVQALQHDDHEPITGASKMFSKPILTRTRRLVLLLHSVMEKAILIVAFVAFCTGIATYWGLFNGRGMLNGIAHWIKGGVFFWLGIFNLGRWCGCFADIGWAWNTRPGNPEKKSWISCEFVESSLIFFYGSTNIFLEHLAGWGKAWTARDLEHVAITVLFIGGGLCGILVEYTRVKGLGEHKVHLQTIPAWSNEAADERPRHRPSGVSMNPLPALVIFLMGASMSSHEQDSMVSTMVHKQWGNLLGAASVARLLTYMIMYLKPPTSASPSRPPTELIMSFCLISGGILFMASSSDTIDGMIHFGVDAMALYTVTMGFTGVLMAWIIVLLALKGRASR